MNRYAFAGGNPISGIEIDGHLFGMSFSDIGHLALDVVGLVPVVGEVADLANAAWYAAEGDYVNAALSAASAIPFAGYAATGTKLAIKGADAVGGAVKASDEVAAATTKTGSDASGAAAKTGPDATPSGGTHASEPAPANPPPTPKPAPAPAKVAPSKADPSAAQAGRACNCFPAGTEVATEDGDKSIEDIEVGDRVWARDLTTGESQLRTVVGLFEKQAERLVTVEVGGESVDVTPEHPFWVVGRG